VVTIPKSSRRRAVLVLTVVSVLAETNEAVVSSFETSLAVDPRRLPVEELYRLIIDVRELRRLPDAREPRRENDEDKDDADPLLEL
jgi:hypothetical protein